MCITWSQDEHVRRERKAEHQYLLDGRDEINMPGEYTRREHNKMSDYKHHYNSKMKRDMAEVVLNGILFKADCQVPMLKFCYMAGSVGWVGQAMARPNFRHSFTHLHVQTTASMYDSRTELTVKGCRGLSSPSPFSKRKFGARERSFHALQFLYWDMSSNSTYGKYW